jgi:hypothetical protein
MSKRNKKHAAASQARIEANRRNAQLSTGPRTLEGKANSSRNAFKHGITAKHVLINNVEDAQAFEDLAQDIRDHFQPQSNYEHRLVDQLIIVEHHQTRIRFIQSALLQIEVQRLDLPALGMREDIPAHYKLPLAFEKLSETKALEAANRELTRLSREHARITNQLDKIRQNPPAQNEPIAEPESPVQIEPITAPPQLPLRGPSISKDAAISGNSDLLTPNFQLLTP